MEVDEKIFIKKYGKTEQELTINNIFRFMQGYSYAENWERWKNYYNSRNNTALEYNINKARNLIEIIPDFIKDTEYLPEKLREKQNVN